MRTTVSSLVDRVTQQWVEIVITPENVDVRHVRNIDREIFQMLNEPIDRRLLYPEDGC